MQPNYANHWINFEDRRREENPELLKETSYTTTKNEDLENFSKTEDVNSDKKNKEAVYLHGSWHSNDNDFSENAAKDISNSEDNQDLNKSFETDDGNFKEDQSPPSIKDRFIQESEINKELDDKNSRRVGEYDIVEGKDGQLYAIRVEDSGESADGTPNKRYRKIGSILDIIRISNGHTNGPRWEPQHGREHEYDKTQEVDQSLDLRNTDDVNDENDIRAYGQINLGLDLNEPNLETSRWASLDESTTRSTDRNTNPHQSDRSSDEERSENREHKDSNVNRMLAIEEERVNHKVADGDFDHLIFEDLNAFTEVKDRNDLSDTKTETISIDGSQIEDDDNVDEDIFEERGFQKNLRSYGHSEISLKDHNKPNIEGLKNSEIFQNIDKNENTQESDGRSRKSKKIAQSNSDDFSKHRQRVQVEEEKRHLLDEAWFWTPNKIQDVEFDGQDGKISVEENEKLEQDRHVAGEELYKVNLPKHVTIDSEIEEYGTFEEVIPMDAIQEDHQLERSKERVDARVNEPDTERILGDESESENEARYERKIHEDGDFGQKILKVSTFSSKETGLIDESIEEEIYPISDSQIADSFGSGEEDGMDHRRGGLEDSNILNAQHQDIKKETKLELSNRGLKNKKVKLNIFPGQPATTVTRP
ncbi:hypothetical protein GQR58_000863 [Nymphon striatum]|nr:hypothetical protein GQR58_000863 [Nymphon striatum]